MNVQDGQPFSSTASSFLSSTWQVLEDEPATFIHTGIGHSSEDGCCSSFSSEKNLCCWSSSFVLFPLHCQDALTIATPGWLMNGSMILFTGFLVASVSAFQKSAE